MLGLTNHPTIDDIKTLLDRGEFDEALIKIEQSNQSINPLTLVSMIEGHLSNI